jgi:hypothetical protein
MSFGDATAAAAAGEESANDGAVVELRTPEGTEEVRLATPPPSPRPSARFFSILFFIIIRWWALATRLMVVP